MTTGSSYLVDVLGNHFGLFYALEGLKNFIRGNKRTLERDSVLFSNQSG